MVVFSFRTSPAGHVFASDTSNGIPNEAMASDGAAQGSQWQPARAGGRFLRGI
jgi:hypothetical protein